MLRRRPLLKEFELQELKKRCSFAQKLRLFEEMFRYAVEIGAFPCADPLSGIEHDIERTRKIHAVRTVTGPAGKGI